MAGINLQECKRIIISRSDNIGDVILTFPMAKALKEANPNLHISFLGKAYTASLIKRCPYIDELINLDDLKTLKEIEKALSGYDVILHVYPNKKIEKAAKKAKIPNRVTFTRKPLNWIYSNYNLNFTRRKSDLHEAQLNLKMLQPFGIKSEYSLKELSSFKVLKSSEENPVPNRVILHAKSKGSAKEWPIANFVQLAELLVKEGIEVFFTGTDNEREFIEPYLPTNDKIHSLIGTLSLDELIDFIGNSEALVAASTGPLHIAASMGIKAVGLYVPKRPMHPGRWGAIGPKAVNLVFDPQCTDCQNGGDCKCIQSITAAKVIKHLV